MPQADPDMVARMREFVDTNLASITTAMWNVELQNSDPETFQIAAVLQESLIMNNMFVRLCETFPEEVIPMMNAITKKR